MGSIRTSRNQSSPASESLEVWQVQDGIPECLCPQPRALPDSSPTVDTEADAQHAAAQMPNNQSTNAAGERAIALGRAYGIPQTLTDTHRSDAERRQAHNQRATF